MGESFKLTISKVINTTLHSCRSKHPADLPEEPVSALFRLSPNSKLITVNFPVNRLPSRMKPNHHFRRNSSTSESTNNIPRSSGSTEFKWQKEEKWHVIASVYGQNQPPPPNRKTRLNTKKKLVSLPPPAQASASASSGRKKISSSHREKKKTVMINTPSEEYCSARFSNDGGDERSGEKPQPRGGGKQTLVPTVVDSFNTNSEEEEVIRESHTRRQKRRNKKKGNHPSKTTTSIEIIHRQSSVSSTTELGSPARLSKFKKFIPCNVDGKVKESFAIVKKSEDPYEDFKRSMIEMIMEKQIYEKDDLEQLLQCFLSLNSTHYHILIVSAFTEIWESMFSAASRYSFHHHP